MSYIVSSLEDLTVNNDKCHVDQTINQPLANAKFIPVVMDATIYDPLNLHDTSIQNSGTATGTQTSSTLQDTTQSWTTNQYQNMIVRITGGTGSGQVRKIVSNTSNTLTIGSGFYDWVTTPDATSTYEILISHRITIATPGDYFLNTRLTFNANTTGLRGTAIYLNDGFIVSEFCNPVDNVESKTLFTWIFNNLAVGDYIDIAAYQSTGINGHPLLSAGNRVYMQLSRL